MIYKIYVFITYVLSYSGATALRLQMF